MATFVGSVHNSSDLVKDYVCGACESKQIVESADYSCETCMKFFCGKCIHHHDQLYANHSKYGRGEINKWPLTKKTEDLLMKCDVHKEEKLKMFCQDHSQLCCSDCVLLNHRHCTNVALISESVKKLSVDLQQLSKNLQTVLNDLSKFKRTQEASFQTVEVSYSDKLQDIRDMRQNLNAALDKLENATLKELGELRAALQTSLKQDIDNCSRLKDELQQLSEAVQDLCDKSSKKELEFIASKKCLIKIQESETYLNENPMKAQRTMIFQADNDLEKYLYTKSSLGTIGDSMQSAILMMNPDQVITVKSKSEFNVRISSDKRQPCQIVNICSMPNGQVIVVDYINESVKLIDQQFNVASHCNVSGSPMDICQVTSCEVAVVVGRFVQFMSVINGQLVNGRKLLLQHGAAGISHHQGALYITSRTALYHYTLTGTLVKKLYEDTGDSSVWMCAVSPAGDRIYVTNYIKHKLLTLATDGSLISTFTDPGLRYPYGVHVTPAGQVLVCGYISHTVIQVDHEGRKKLATLATKNDGLCYPFSVCYNNNINSIIFGQNNNTIIAMEVH